MDCRVLISDIFKLKPFAGFMLTSSNCDSANQSSAAQVALMIFSYVQKTFTFSGLSTGARSETCPWDTHVTHGGRHPANAETQVNTRIQTHVHGHVDRLMHIHTHSRQLHCQR